MHIHGRQVKVTHFHCNFCRWKWVWVGRTSHLKRALFMVFKSSSHYRNVPSVNYSACLSAVTYYKCNPFLSIGTAVSFPREEWELDTHALFSQLVQILNRIYLYKHYAFSVYCQNSYGLSMPNSQIFCKTVGGVLHPTFWICALVQSKDSVNRRIDCLTLQTHVDPAVGPIMQLLYYSLALLTSTAHSFKPAERFRG